VSEQDKYRISRASGLLFKKPFWWAYFREKGLFIGGGFALQKWSGVYLEGILPLKMGI